MLECQHASYTQTVITVLVFVQITHLIVQLGL